jgi:hypothetical protein
MRKLFETRFSRRFADEFYMGGGGGGGASSERNPASQFTLPFGQAIGEVGHGLTDWFGQLKGESMQSMDVLNPRIWQMLNTAFDPQQQLYARTLQQVTDQTRSGEAARGFANTPYGSALEGKGLRDFNIDWENNRLQRMEGGLGSAASAYSQLLGGGATAAQPAEAALQGYTSGFDTASRASTSDLNRIEDAREFDAKMRQQEMSQLFDLGGSFGSLIKK